VETAAGGGRGAGISGGLETGARGGTEIESGIGLGADMVKN
jgi:hypothetical protein